MCGRYYTDVDREEMQNIINAVNRVMADRPELSEMKTGEIFPTNIAPVYINTVGGAEPALMRWGFPGFPKPGSKAKPPVIINARSETITEKPSFSRYLHQRCLVPANLYFEWAQNIKTQDGKKLKFAFQPALSLFWMAAIYRHMEEAGIPVFTILTKDASASVAPIHNRMPVILSSKEARLAWMHGENDLKGLFRDAALQEIVYRPVA